MWNRPMRLCAGVCLLLAGLLPLAPTVQAAPDRVLARVNGEPIYESAVMANMPKNRFDSNLDDLKAVKLGRLIDTMIFRQFLRQHHVTVPESAVDAEIAALKKTPPPAACICCRFTSLQQFLDVNTLSMEEFRAETRNTIGLDQYLRQQWNQQYPTRAARLALAKRERARLAKSNVMLWHIFFNTFQQPGYSEDPERIGKQKKDQADAAWHRLQQGEAFGAVAKAVSDDQMSRVNGGALGCVTPAIFGDEVKATLAHLKPGAYSRPVESVWGFHILKWAPLSDADIVATLKQEAMDSQRKLLYDNLRKQAHIERAKA